MKSHPTNNDAMLRVPSAFRHSTFKHKTVWMQLQTQHVLNAKH